MTESKRTFAKGPYYIVPFKLDIDILEKYNLIYDGEEHNEYTGGIKYFYISQVDYDIMMETHS